MSPYQTPVAAQGTPGSGGISAEAVNQLVRTRKWVKLCSVIGFIGAAFLLLACVGMLLAGGTVGTSSRSLGNMYGGGVMVGVALMYGVMAFFYIYPSVRLWQYASSISRLEQSMSSHDLEIALNYQRSFWKYVGIIVTIGICLYALVIIIAMIGAASMRMH